MDFTKKKIRQAFYKSKEWQILRQYLLGQNPLCELCFAKDRLKPAEAIHHKIDIVDRPDLRLDTNNCQPLCAKCHNSISAMNQAGSEKDLSAVQLKWTDEVIKLKK